MNFFFSNRFLQFLYIDIKVDFINYTVAVRDYRVADLTILNMAVDETGCAHRKVDRNENI